MQRIIKKQEKLSLTDTNDIFNILPIEIIFEILGYLDVKYVNRFAITNKTIHKTIEESYPLDAKVLFSRKKEQKCTYAQVNQILNQQYHLQCQLKKNRQREFKELCNCLLTMLGLVLALYVCEVKIDVKNRLFPQIVCIAVWGGSTIFSVKNDKTQKVKTKVQNELESLPKVVLSDGNILSTF